MHKRLYSVLKVLFFFALLVLFVPYPASAEQTGFRFPTTCTTNGSSCENMRFDDELYNSWPSTQYQDVVTTFTGFGIPNNASIDEIQIKLLIRSSSRGWTWFTQYSVDNGGIFLFPDHIYCSLATPCSYNVETYFNTNSFYNSPYTLTWKNNKPSNGFVDGTVLNSDQFKLKIFQWSGWKTTDIDAVSYNIVYSLPAVTPTPAGPVPFLDLPWDYEGDGRSFNDAALAISSYFDHEYPLLSSGLDLSEPLDAKGSVVTFEGPERKGVSYSSHDGYDYAALAGLSFGKEVRAAAAGSARYVQSESLGNAVFIDHGNGYQTRYLHMQKEGLVTPLSGEAVAVQAGQLIGKVGNTGRCYYFDIQNDIRCSHLHFSVFQDKNADGSFTDNVPDGVTDPYGWEPAIENDSDRDSDFWPSYAFSYLGQEKTGNKSYYLWKKKLDRIKAAIGAEGGELKTGRFTIIFPENSVTGTTNFTLSSSPYVFTEISGKKLRSLGPSLSASGKTLLGDPVTTVLNPYSLKVDYTTAELQGIDPATISIYTSENGSSWIKEETAVDPEIRNATSEINHFSYFALMGELTDSVPPETEIVLTGDRGEGNWYRSNVSVSLIATDNTSSIKHTVYKTEANEDSWHKYTIPLNFSEERSYTVDYYSEDEMGNIEPLKSVTINIDKTLPTLSVDANPKYLWPPDGQMIPTTITGSGSDQNLQNIFITIDDEYDLVEPAISNFGQTVDLKAERKGNDQDGRVYTIKAIAIDKAGNKTAVQTQVLVSHDQGN